MSLPIRALAAWCVLMAVEFAHGVVRAVWLVPVLGDRASRQWGVLSGSVLIFGTTLLMIRRLRPGGRAWHIGAAWVLLTVAFELALGRALGRPWPDLLSDYDLPHGGLLPLGLAVLALSPVLAQRIALR